LTYDIFRKTIIVIRNTEWVYTDAEEKRYNIDKNDFSLTINGEKLYLNTTLEMLVNYTTPNNTKTDSNGNYN